MIRTKVSSLTSSRETWLIPPDNLGWNLIGVTRVQGSKAPFWKVKAWLCLLTCRLSSFSFWATNKLSNFSTWKSLQHFEPYSHETISLDALFSSQLSNTNLPINAARLKQLFFVSKASINFTFWRINISLTATQVHMELSRTLEGWRCLKKHF